MKIHLKKLLISGFVIISFVFYSVYNRAANKNPAGTPLALGAANSGTSRPAGPASYKDGEYTGVSADAYYGNIQVRAVIAGGRISDVVFLDYPKDRQTSVLINSQAMPILKSEAISSQAAQVDVVSGATDTSYAFINSLASALNQAYAQAAVNAAGNAGQTHSAALPSVPPAPAPSGQAVAADPPPLPKPTVAIKVKSTASTALKDGTYTGNSVDVYYGNVQVRAAISGGKLASVSVIDAPKEQTSVLINNQAFPALKSEAIKAQSAKINAVSGATYTSYGFQQSLASALNKAIPVSQTPGGVQPSRQDSQSIAKPPAPAEAPSLPAAITPAPTPAQTVSQPTSSSTGMKDGAYTGSSVNVYYGNVQVQAVISGGRIAGVSFLDYPGAHQTSVIINSQAMPTLKSEAIAAQSSQVNAVSGATYTSQGFMQSLASALAQAGIQPTPNGTQVQSQTPQTGIDQPQSQNLAQPGNQTVLLPRPRGDDDEYEDD